MDVRPGDRAASCGALMEPVAAVRDRDQTAVIQRCTGCGRVWRNRSAGGDRQDVLLPLFAQPVIDPEPDPSGLGGLGGRGSRPRVGPYVGLAVVRDATAG